MNDSLKARVEVFADRMRTLPMRAGDIDLDALGLTKEQFVEKYRSADADPAEVLERFLASENA